MSEESKEAAGSEESAGSSIDFVTLGAVGGMGVLMLVLGFAVSYFILPGMISESISQKIDAKIAEMESGEHGEDAHGEAASGGHGEAAAGGHGEAAAGGHGEAAAGGHGGGHGEAAAGGHGGGHGEAAAEPPKEERFILKDMLVNIRNTRGSRFLKASLDFDAPLPVRKELEQIRPKVIHVVSAILSDQTLDQLTAPDSRGILQRKIRTAVNALLTSGPVSDVFFLDFLIN